MNQLELEFSSCFAFLFEVFTPDVSFLGFFIFAGTTGMHLCSDSCSEIALLFHFVLFCIGNALF